ncbi:MAG: MotA/TolQ/ExbB proton channel family protein [Planctomycetaceae bacterium]|nr:MotA/TolQ/ExbB proton channel family protein [Planctomycetaceae bacterium]
MVCARRLALLVLGLIVLGLMAPPRALADPPPTLELTPKAAAPPPRAKESRTTPKAKPSAEVGRRTILGLFSRANPMVWLLAICSVVTLGFALERLVALRRERVIPREFVNRFLERLSSGKLDRDRAAEVCRANESAAARVFAMIISYWGQPAATIRQAIGYDAAGELSELKRNIRVLNGTATLAPLLGLLGTVIGMIQSFDALGGRVGLAKGEALAQGISLALVSTALGLAIAVVSVAAYYYLLNRVDVLVRELDEYARQVVDLVCGEAVRPALPPDRRPNVVHPSGNDQARHDPSRVH